MEEPRIGVFICKCGGNIGNTVDVEAVAGVAKGWKNVIFSTFETYMCSKVGLELIRTSIEKYRLNRVVVASCSPRLHETTFRTLVESAGLNPYFFEMVNIREHNSWVHADKNEATKKAIDLVRAGVYRARYLEPLQVTKQKCSKSVLVIGGGVAGITAALNLANSDYYVYLVEREPSIGGHMAMLGKVFPTLDCAQCILTPRMADCSTHPNIKLLTYSEVLEVTGTPGNFHVKIRMKPRYIDPEKCVACGNCEKICPWKAPSEFDLGLSSRKAAYRMFPQAVPNTYIIDGTICAYVKSKKCGACLKVCSANAINFEDKEKIVEYDVGAIICATGYDLFDIEKLTEFGYNYYPEVINALQMERLLSATGPTGGYLRKPEKNKNPNEWKEAKKVAYVACVGSRDVNRGVPYCSRICCMYTIKQALLIKELLPETEVWFFYIDVRAPGRGYEEFYDNAQSHGVKFVKGKVSDIFKQEKDNRVTVRAEDTLLGNYIENEFDLVVLCPALVPDKSLFELADKLKIPLGEDGFILEKHPKLNPVSTLRDGIYACGCVLAPKDVRDSVSEAGSAASKVNELLSAGEVAISPEKAVVNEILCNGCGDCVKICPTKAMSLKNGKAIVDVFACNGCGACIPACKQNAVDLKNSTEKQILSQIEGLLEEKTDKPVIVAFLDNETAYNAADMIGLSRLNYPAQVRIIRVPSTARIGLKHILYAFAYGADGVFLGEGAKGSGSCIKANEITEERQREYKRLLRGYGVEHLRLRYSELFIPQFRKMAELLSIFTASINDLGKLKEATREKIKKEALKIA
jgi:heterodisulfide reductase subunit A